GGGGVTPARRAPRGVGGGRAALLAAAEDPQAGLIRFTQCLALELRLLISALGKYAPDALDRDDVWSQDFPAIPAAG
ncbi:glutamate synthase, partial [Streptomyces erythrochromogenes]